MRFDDFLQFPAVPVVYIEFQNRERHEEGPKHASFFSAPLWNKIGRSAILFGVQMGYRYFVVIGNDVQYDS